MLVEHIHLGMQPYTRTDLDKGLSMILVHMYKKLLVYSPNYLLGYNR